MVATAESVEWIEVRNEVEALMLEYTLIKQHRPALQHPPARRQELPVPRRHARRAVPAGAGDARPQAQGHALLRSVRPRLRHPRHARPAAAQLPDPHLQPGQVQRAPPPRPSVPAVPHREVQRAVRRRDRRDAYRQLVDELCDFLDGDTDEIVRRLDRRCARRPRTSSSSGRPASATASTPCSGRSRSSRWWPRRNEDIDVIGIAEAPTSGDTRRCPPPGPPRHFFRLFPHLSAAQQASIFRFAPRRQVP